MPPVPVHIDDPIKPNQANEPSRAAPNDQANQQNYPAAQPGAAAVPAPTPFLTSNPPQPPPTRTTDNTSQYAPPAPQPGAVPVASAQQFPATVPSGIPPPPKAGEKYHPPPTTTMPPQMAIPPPQQNYAPVHGTVAAVPQNTSTPGPTTLTLGSVYGQQGGVPPPASHPPGYQQNVFAQEMSSAQRASLEQHERNEGLSLGYTGNDSTNDTVGNMWNAVKGWATVAGTKLAETEEQVWKRINSGK